MPSFENDILINLIDCESFLFSISLHVQSFVATVPNFVKHLVGMNVKYFKTFKINFCKDETMHILHLIHTDKLLPAPSHEVNSNTSRIFGFGQQSITGSNGVGYLIFILFIF